MLNWSTSEPLIQQVLTEWLARIKNERVWYMLNQIGP